MSSSILQSSSGAVQVLGIFVLSHPLLSFFVGLLGQHRGWFCSFYLPKFVQGFSRTVYVGLAIAGMNLSSYTGSICLHQLVGWLSG